jgi:hypothetical protein
MSPYWAVTNGLSVVRMAHCRWGAVTPRRADNGLIIKSANGSTSRTHQSVRRSSAAETHGGRRLGHDVSREGLAPAYPHRRGPTGRDLRCTAVAWRVRSLWRRRASRCAAWGPKQGRPAGQYQAPAKAVRGAPRRRGRRWSCSEATVRRWGRPGDSAAVVRRNALIRPFLPIPGLYSGNADCSSV